MKVKHLLTVALLFVATLASAQQMPPIPVDKAVRIGKLSNGLTYYIRHNDYPEHVVNFYIAQRVGSIQEDDNQRGLAHFLEHMAFNGSEHFPDSLLLEYTRSLGVEFGSDLNAYTSIDRTVYRICDVPSKRQTAIDSCLLILKDWSNGLTLSSKEIDKERGVIHQEWQLRSTATQRMYERSLPLFYPGSKYGHRMPIGLMEIVDNFKPDFLRAYYHKWYRPDNQAIIVVGDVDVNHIEAEIKNLWKDSTVPANAPQVVDEPVPDNDKAIYVVEKDKEQQYTIIGINMKHDAETPADKKDISYYFGDYAKNIIVMMLNQRFSDMILKPECPFLVAYGGDGEYLLSKTKDAFELAVMPKEGKDIEALKSAYREALRARRFGFTPTEFDRCKEEIVSSIDKAYTNRNKRKNAEYGNEYTENYLDGDPIPSVEEYTDIMKKQIIPLINVDVINMVAKQLISESDTNLVVYAFQQEKDGQTYLKPAEMEKAIAEVRAEDIEPYVDNAKNEPLIAPEAMPKKGSITGETENKTMGFKTLTLSNGARVVLKKTDFKDDEVVFQGVAKGGTGLYGAADYSNLKLVGVTLMSTGLGNFTNNELEKALYGKQVSLSPQIGNYYTIIGGQTVPKDIETMLQLNYLYFTSIKPDTTAYNAGKSQLEMVLKNKHLNPESVFSDSLTLTIYGHNQRFAPVDVDDVAKADYNRMLQIGRERLKNAANFTFYFVGNFDEATLRPLIEQYIASLPATKPDGKLVNLDIYANGEIENQFSRKMETPKCIAFEFWHADAPYTLENEIVADAAGQVLSMVYLKDIREDASAAYSVGAAGGQSRHGDKSTLVLQAYCPMDPAKVDLALDLLAKGFNANTIKVDADKVQKVKDYMLKNADEQAKKNGHWMDVIDEYIQTGVDLQTDYKKTVEALTPEKIANFLKQLKLAGNHAEVVMTPEK